MITVIDPGAWPVVFLSYDEPNAEQHWQQLLRQRPDSLRVHGVKGSDAAHKACAAEARTERFFTVDGDCRADKDFWRQKFTVAAELAQDSTVFSFASRNTLNGLAYGNGGIKLWSRQTVLEMRTHEAHNEPDSATDFCWALDYVLMPGIWAQTEITGSPQQAWRAGFREGVKFSMIEGRECKDPDLWQRSIDPPNLRRLCQWQQIGLDAANGAWAILGARQGFHRALLTDWTATDVQDFDRLAELWQHCGDWDRSSVDEETQRLGREILDAVSIDITVKPLAAEHSRWFKRFCPPEERKTAKRLRS